MKWIQQNKRISSKTSMINRYWIILVVAIIIAVITIILYSMNVKIPDGILLVETNVDLVQTYYGHFIDHAMDYDLAYPYEERNAVMVTAKQGYEQILFHELKRVYPSGYIRFLYMDRRLRLQTLELIWLLLGIHLLIVTVHRIWPRAMKYYNYGIYGVSFLTLCYVIRSRFVIPSQWIPVKLLDWQGWWSNIGKYDEQNEKLRNLIRTEFHSWSVLQETLWIILGLGIVYYIVISITKRKVRVGD